MFFAVHALSLTQFLSVVKFCLKSNQRSHAMEGIQYVTNDKGQNVAVMIDLKKYGEVWEDFYDILTARARANEPREILESVKELLEKQGKLNG